MRTGGARGRRPGQEQLRVPAQPPARPGLSLPGPARSVPAAAAAATGTEERGALPGRGGASVRGWAMGGATAGGAGLGTGEGRGEGGGTRNGNGIGLGEGNRG